jgi:hypothetical protein
VKEKGELGRLSSFQPKAFTFSSRLCFAFQYSLVWEATHPRTHSHFPVPYRYGLLPKIASIELHLHSLYLHLPKKAIRFELSSIWFQECTYLYLSHVLSWIYSTSARVEVYAVSFQSTRALIFLSLIYRNHHCYTKSRCH